ncbi:unnamed protein product [Effrenium voratum]|uniref:Uncharacterized protein n=1 Tax=Effrenium voratum TaxID=2562239 RepID=A0AA36HXF9_9DINO|nr:unnamed protein product [Effrenium voratum]CAJ1422160.1 unnamed protein product [Effrenium voratum]
MLPNANCLFVAVLVVAATATRIAVESKLEQSKLEHPQLDLPSSAQVAGRVTTDGLVKWSSTGAVSYKKAKFLYVTAVSDHNIHFQEKPKSGALHRHTTFVGWNNLLTGTVTRYLFVTDYDEEREILSWCKTSTEPRDKGYIDPFVEVEEKFRLESALGPVWSWKLPKKLTSYGTQLLADMYTEVDGKDTINATVVSTRDRRNSTYTAEYSLHAQSALSDHDSLIYKYLDHSCETVSDFRNVPEICVDELLAVEYECGYAELQLQ